MLVAPLKTSRLLPYLRMFIMTLQETMLSRVLGTLENVMLTAFYVSIPGWTYVTASSRMGPSEENHTMIPDVEITMYKGKNQYAIRLPYRSHHKAHRRKLSNI